MGIGCRRAVVGLTKHRFGPGAGIGSQRISFARLDFGARTDGLQIDLWFARLRRSPCHDGSASDRCDYKEMRKYLHSAQQFRLRQTR